MHGIKGLQNFQDRIGKDLSLFMDFSRGKAKEAQSREFVTFQPKESLSTLSKAKVTITNYLGGQYFLTVDELLVTKDKVSLIEGKHTVNAILPSKGDIKDGLLKMILYCNLIEVTINGNAIVSEAVLCLTSTKLKGGITSSSSKSELSSFFNKNNLSASQTLLIETIIAEAIQNNFIIKVQYSK